jgi:hypothetical protein
VRALMMIRAYRMRGHLHADLDPLALEPAKDHEELHPSTYGFTEADWDRKIFIDFVLGLEYATIREMLALLKPHLIARRSVGSFSTFRILPRRAGSKPASKVRTKRSRSRVKASEPF